MTTIMLSEAELEELYRFTEQSYISAKDFPALLQLLNRIARYRQIREHQSA